MRLPRIFRRRLSQRQMVEAKRGGCMVFTGKIVWSGKEYLKVRGKGYAEKVISKWNGRGGPVD